MDKTKRVCFPKKKEQKKINYISGAFQVHMKQHLFFFLLFKYLVQWCQPLL